MFDHIRAADRVIMLLNTLLLMMVAFLPFTTSVLAGALHSGHGQRTAAVLYGIAFDATALTFNAVWQYAYRHRLLKDTLDPPGATAISRRFQLALAWLAIGALLGLLIPVLGMVVIAAFNVFTGSRSGARAPPTILKQCPQRLRGAQPSGRRALTKNSGITGCSARGVV